MNRIIYYLFISKILFLSACTTSYKLSPKNLGDGINVATPSSQSVDHRKLNMAAHQVFQFDRKTSIPNIDHMRKYTGIESLLVAKNNKLIYEKYFNGASETKPHFVASLSKSILSALVGIAIDNVYIKSVDDEIYQYLPYKSYRNWDERKQNISIKHLLTMTAGWDCGNIGDYSKHCGFLMNSKEDPYKWVLDLPLVEAPGKVFNYNDATPKILAAIITLASKQNIATIYREKLMKQMQLDTNMFLTQTMTSRDMLKFGLLYLNHGKWKDQQLISKEWVSKSTAQTIKFNQSSNANSYGFFWWHRDFNARGKQFSSYYAVGNGGQYIFIVPELELVVVLTGYNYGSLRLMRQPIEIIEKYVIPSIISNV